MSSQPTPDEQAFHLQSEWNRHLETVTHGDSDQPCLVCHVYRTSIEKAFLRTSIEKAFLRKKHGAVRLPREF